MQTVITYNYTLYTYDIYKPLPHRANFIKLNIENNFMKKVLPCAKRRTPDGWVIMDQYS